MADPDECDFEDVHQPPLDRYDTGLIVMVGAVLLGFVLAVAYAWHQGAFWANRPETATHCK